MKLFDARFYLPLIAGALLIGATSVDAQTEANVETPVQASTEALGKRPSPQIEVQLANELLALARPLAGKESELALRSSHAIAVALAQLGRTTEALRVAPAEDAFYSRDFPARDEVWAAMARRKLAFGKISEARQAADRIQSPAIKGGVLAAFASQSLQRDQKSEALAFLSQAVKADGAAAGRDIRLAVLFARVGETATARRILARAEAALERSDDVTADDFGDSSNLSWNHLIDAYIEAGLSREVAALVTRVGRHRTDALDQLLSANQFDAVRALIGASKDVDDQTHMKISLAWALASSGQADAARKVLIEAEKTLRVAPGKAEISFDLLFSSIAWYVAGDDARAQQQWARLGESGRLLQSAWGWRALGSLKFAPPTEAEARAQWESRLQEFAARALELSVTPSLELAPDATSALRTLGEQTEQSGRDELATDLLQALDKWMALTPPASDDENSATPRQEIRLYLASAWRKRGQNERAQHWITQFLSAPDEANLDRAAESIKAGFVDEGRAYAVKFYQAPREINAYSIAPAEAAALLDNAPARQSFIDWSRRFPAQRVELLTQFAAALTQPALEQNGGAVFTLGQYEYDLRG